MLTQSRRRALGATVASIATCALLLTPITAANAAPTPVGIAPAAIVADPIINSADDAAISLSPIGTYETGVFDESAAEIVAYYGDRLFVVNAQAGDVDVLDFSDPRAIAKKFSISVDGIANSVAIRKDGLGVIAVENTVKTDPGHLVFFDANADRAEVLGSVTVGALPDMVTISEDGKYAVVANEGEPSDDFTIDPEGSISVISLPNKKVQAPKQQHVKTADFHAFEKNLPEGVRVFGPTPHSEVAASADPVVEPAATKASSGFKGLLGKLLAAIQTIVQKVKEFFTGGPSEDESFPVSRNLEPEYVTIDGNKAYVSLQEANAVAVVHIPSAKVTDILPLGFQDHGVVPLDPSDRDGGYNPRTFPGLYGIYMPDGIESYKAGKKTYLVTANEGDAREWGDYVEASRVKNLDEDGYGPVCATSPLAGLTGDADLGRLNVTIENGFNSSEGCYDELYAFGSRSFSIWTTDGTQVFDSGSGFEEAVYAANPDFFNSNHTESNFEGRSDDKGPEPENLTIGEVDGRTYAFVGLERVGGIMVYDITTPAESFFVTYVNNRDFSVSVEDDGALAEAGDLGAEGLTFIPAEHSPTGKPLVAVANEVSGTTTLFEVGGPQTEIQVLTVNDFHGRVEQGLSNGEAGAAVIAGAVDHFEAQNPNTLFVSSGDNIGASTFTSFINSDEPAIDVLRKSGLDVGVVGNHEFDQGWDDLITRVTPRFGGGQFSLGANVYHKGTHEPALQEYAIEEVDGVRVAFIGTVTEQTAAMVSPTGIADIEFGDQLEATNRVAAELTATDAADAIILLTHEGAAGNQCADVAADTTVYGDLIRGASADIDAIVSGHTHQAYNCLVPVDGTNDVRPVIQAHQYGTTLGKLDLTIDTKHKELTSIKTSLVPLVVDGQAAFPADPVVQAIVDAAVAEADVLGSVEVGEITADITRGGTAGSDRGVESTIGNLVADVYLWATSNPNYAGTPAQIGIMNPGGLRADLLYGTDGTLTYRDVANVQPFANTLVTVSLTGAQLKTVLEEQWQPAGSSRPKLHLGISEGFTYEYNENAAEGSRIGSMTLNGVTIDPAAEYTVVTNSFVAAGGDNFFTFAEGTNRADTGQIDLIATVEFFEQAGPVDPAPLGRAVNVTE